MPNVNADDVLTDAFAAGKASYPLIKVDRERFASRARVLALTDDVIRDRAADLYLAVGCESGDPEAIRTFEREFIAPVFKHVARFRLSEADVDELRQQLRVKFLSGPSPRIAAYGAQGPLGAWVRAAAIRATLDMQDATARTRARRTSDDGLFETLTTTILGGEDLVARARHTAEVRRALETALAALPDRDKNVLRLHLVDGLSGQEIGTLYGVHRATVGRWLVTIQKQMFESLRHELGDKVSSSASGFRSVIRAVGADVRLTLSRVLPAARG